MSIGCAWLQGLMHCFVLIFVQASLYVVMITKCFLIVFIHTYIMSTITTALRYRLWAWWAYVAVLAFFHFSEYFTTALFKGSTLSFDCLLLCPVHHA